MSDGNSKIVTSSQAGIHDRLTELVLRYRSSSNRKPFADHTLHAFREAEAWLTGHEGDLILDAGCGTGQSTAYLAQQYPDAKVIGVDRSDVRLKKHQAAGDDNYLLLRADIRDFWRLARQHQWQVALLCLLYPNPYPKPTQVQRRWHASASMVDLMAISERVEVRSNWRLYCEEFAHACSLYGWQAELCEVSGAEFITAFERKYRQSNQTCWQLECQPRKSGPTD